jgi:ADP-ribose pyrophosphatase YjhB (NUDIX family)
MCRAIENFVGIFRLQDVKCKILKGKRTFNSSITKQIEDEWQRQKKKNNRLFNGRVFSLINFSIKKNELHLTLQETDYKSFVGTNLNNSIHIKPQERANPIGFNMLLETFDNFFFLALRSSDVQEAKNQWHGVGGNLDTTKLKENIYSEFLEEINLKEEYLTKILIMGMVENCISHRSEIMIYAKTNLTAEKVRKNLVNAKDGYEYSKTVFLDENGLKDFLNNENLTNTTISMIEMYLTQKDKL